MHMGPWSVEGTASNCSRVMLPSHLKNARGPPPGNARGGWRRFLCKAVACKSDIGGCDCGTREGALSDTRAVSQSYCVYIRAPYPRSHVMAGTISLVMDIRRYGRVIQGQIVESPRPLDGVRVYPPPRLQAHAHKQRRVHIYTYILATLKHWIHWLTAMIDRKELLPSRTCS